MDLKEALASLKKKLESSVNFSPDNHSHMDPRLESILDAQSTYPVSLFVEWLERTPEAREALAGSGLGWGGQATPVDQGVKRIGIEPAVIGGSGLCFTVLIGSPQRLVGATLVDVIGSVLKVRLESQAHVTALPISCVSPSDRGRVEQAIAKMPGRNTETVWEDDPGLKSEPSDGNLSCW